jgi:hypothetical protein
MHPDAVLQEALPFYLRTSWHAGHIQRLTDRQAFHPATISMSEPLPGVMLGDGVVFQDIVD